jgi:hypothetical protein
MRLSTLSLAATGLLLGIANAAPGTSALQATSLFKRALEWYETSSLTLDTASMGLLGEALQV